MDFVFLVFPNVAFLIIVPSCCALDSFICSTCLVPYLSHVFLICPLLDPCGVTCVRLVYVVLWSLSFVPIFFYFVLKLMD